MEGKKIERFCNKCNLVTEHDFIEEISNDVRTIVMSCRECGETETDHDPIDIDFEEGNQVNILSREQLIDIVRCGDDKIESCRDCNFYNECNCGAKSVVAKTAVALFDKNEKLKALNRELVQLLKESYGKLNGWNREHHEIQSRITVAIEKAKGIE